MNIKKRKGYSMIEVMFIMLLIVSLLSISISKLSTSNNAAVYTSLETDALNGIYALTTAYTEINDYREIANNQSFVDNDGDGFSDTFIPNTNIRFPISKGNVIYIDTSVSYGFYLAVYNNSVDKLVLIDTTQSSKIKLL